MKKGLSLRTAALLVALLAVFGTTLNQTVKAETQCVAPVPFYRFIVNNSELGTLLTTNYQEGVNLNFAYYPFPNGYGKIVLPPAGAGWTPVAGQGLQPLYRYHVTQNGRIYYAYTNSPASGSGYTYQGIAGYTLPGFGQYGGIALQAYYSQTKGYFYTADTEVPIGYPYYYGFAYHGSPAYLPQGSSYCWQRPDCDPAAEQACYDNGGSWNPSTCRCTIRPDPCRQEAPKGDRGTKDEEQQLAPLPCRQSN